MSNISDGSSYVDASVDSIISGYENKIGQNIATKILNASKKGKTPLFSDEELLYLNKRDSENKKNDPNSEVEVITPIPNITLKKGNTELNIGHAVSIIKKMEEKFPTGVNKDKAEEITRQVMAQEGEQTPITRNQFVKSVNFPVKNVSDEVKQSVWLDGATEIPKEKSIETKSKNAYEIRESILSHALSWIKYKRSLQDNHQPIPTEDDVLDIAQKFYKFVENRR